MGAGDGALIGGFVLETTEPNPVFVRAVGPGLDQFGVSSWLVDPVLQVYRHPSGAAPELIAANDDWAQSETASLSASAAPLTGAFALTADSRDAALLLQLPAGVYSVVVSGADGGEGVALVEVYHVK